MGGPLGDTCSVSGCVDTFFDLPDASAPPGASSVVSDRSRETQCSPTYAGSRNSTQIWGEPAIWRSMKCAIASLVKIYVYHRSMSPTALLVKSHEVCLIVCLPSPALQNSTKCAYLLKFYEVPHHPCCKNLCLLPSSAL